MLKRLHQIGLLPALYKIKNLLIPDKDIVGIASRNGAYEYLLRYKSACANVMHKPIEPKEKIIWTCWLQGEENAPLIVKRCLASMRQNAYGYKVIVLDKQSIPKYVTVPDYIESKHQTGIIPHAHYSDIVRLMLLQKYGGVWIDSTIFLTGALPKYITDSPLFCYQPIYQGHVELANCFFASDKNHPIITAELDLLLAYWKKENKLVSYSLFHLMWAIAVHSSEELYVLWKNVPFVPGLTIDVLRHDLSLPYSETRWKDICSISNVHKLTYKFAEFGIDTESKGTFYDVLINEQTNRTL